MSPALHFERLENRRLLAAHNFERPYDVNDDAELSRDDVAMVREAVVASRGPFRGKPATDGPPFLDTNSDGRVSLLDVLAVVNALNAPKPPTEPIRWDGNGHDYSVVDNYTSWYEALLHASSLVYEGRRGHLATITSEDEQQFIEQQVLRPQGGIESYFAYIGLSDNEAYGGYESSARLNWHVDGWAWITGEPFEYGNWNYRQPNGGVTDYPYQFDSDFGEISAGGTYHGQWYDDATTGRSKFYVVEFAGTYATASRGPLGRPLTWPTGPVRVLDPPPTEYTNEFVPLEWVGNGHWYLQVNNTETPVSWDEAKEEAEKLEHRGLKGHLVTLSSQEEANWIQFWIRRLISIDRSIGYGANWIGLSRDGATEWKWVNDEPFDFADWRDGHPRGSDLYAWLSSSGWYGKPTPWARNTRHGFIVEFE